MDDERIAAKPLCRSYPVSKWARCLGMADPEGTSKGHSPGTERRRRQSSLRGVATTPSYNTTDVRSFFDHCASTGFHEQHGHPPRLLEYRLALVRDLARPTPRMSSWTLVAATA